MPAPVNGLDGYRADRRLTGPVALDATGSLLAVVHADAGGQQLTLLDPGTGVERVVRLDARVVAAVRLVAEATVLVLAEDGDGPCLHLVPWSGEPRRVPVPVPGSWYVRGEPLAPDGTLLAFGYDAAGARGLRVLRVDIARACLEQVVDLGSEEITVPISWHPSGRRLALLCGGSAAPPRVGVLDLADADAGLHFWTGADGARWLPGPWTGDDELLALSDLRSDVWALRLLGPDGPRAEVGFETVHPFPPPAGAAAQSGEVEAVAGGADGTWFSVNQYGFSRLYRRPSGGPARPVTLPDGVITRLACSADGRRLALRLQTADAPPEIWLVEAGGGARPVLRAERLGADLPRAPARLEFVDAPEGRALPVLAFGTQAVPRAVVVSVHNGPEAQERPRMAHSGLYQYLAGQGVVVLAPNLGGSTGAGLAEAARVVDDWGGKDLEDLLAVLDWARRTYPDAPLGLYGVSYGGFLSLLALSRFSGVTAAACVAAPCNLASFVARVPPMFGARICSPRRKAASRASYLWSRSPMAIAHQVEADLLLVQGEHDTWVPLADAEEMRDRVLDAGGRAQVRVVAGAGHHLGPRSRSELQRVADFLLSRLARAAEPSR